LDELQNFTIPGVVSFWGDDDTGSCLHISNGGSGCTIYLFGAHPIMWQPAGGDDVLWLSEAVAFDLKRAIRGGVPVCWPWFGEHPEHSDWPLHGFARTCIWTLDKVDRLGDAVEVQLSLPVLPEHAQFWPHRTRPTITYTIGKTFEMTFSTTNIDPHSISFSQALHSYLTIEDIADVSITGLEAARYIDKLTGLEEPAAGEPITIASETDRIYRNPNGPIELRDSAHNRALSISHEGASSAVVWNPWIEKSARIGDMGSADAYRGMICIETGNVPPDDITLEPGATHTLKTTISACPRA